MLVLSINHPLKLKGKVVLSFSPRWVQSFIAAACCKALVYTAVYISSCGTVCLLSVSELCSAGSPARVGFRSLSIRQPSLEGIPYFPFYTRKHTLQITQRIDFSVWQWGMIECTLLSEALIFSRQICFWIGETETRPFPPAVVVSEMSDESAAHRPVEMLPLLRPRDERKATQLQVGSPVTQERNWRGTGSSCAHTQS